VAQVLAASAPQVIEAGAGSGRLAADLLLALDALGCLPERYRILELSGELRARQQATLHERAPRLADRVEWLDELPERFSGCLVGNEVLDAMPTHALRWSDDGSGRPRRRRRARGRPAGAGRTARDRRAAGGGTGHAGGTPIAARSASRRGPGSRNWRAAWNRAPCC
jgi:hypothetical protein